MWLTTAIAQRIGQDHSIRRLTESAQGIVAELAHHLAYAVSRTLTEIKTQCAGKNTPAEAGAALAKLAV